jgi:hypothetical protein
LGKCLTFKSSLLIQVQDSKNELWQQVFTEEDALFDISEHWIQHEEDAEHEAENP